MMLGLMTWMSTPVASISRSRSGSSVMRCNSGSGTPPGPATARVLRILIGPFHHFRHEDVGVHGDDGRPGSRALRSRRFGRCAYGLGRFGTLGSLGCAPRPLAPLG